nr:hypothetical protein [Mycoplasmopsis bovis]
MIVSSNSNQELIKLKGKFLTIKWSGADSSGTRELWIFESISDKERYFIYSSKQGIKSSCFYDIEIKAKSFKRSKYQNQSYELISCKIVSPDNDSDVEKMLSK